MTLASAVLTALSFAAQSPLATQPVEQLPSAEDAATGQPIIQIHAPTRDITGSAPGERDVRPPTQQTQAGDRGAPSQLSREERVAPRPAQLNAAGRTAAAPEPLSSPAQGRRGDQAAVGGRDRCDRVLADVGSDPALRAACARVIETRSAEFARPDPTTLSPEQRLLIEQRLREDRNVQRTAVRRMADGAAASPDDPDSQEVAALALGRPGDGASVRARQEQPADAQVDAAAALVQILITGAGGQSPPQP